MSTLVRGTALIGATMLLGVAAAWGQPQSKEQQKCINKINRGGIKVHEAQGGDNRKCVKDAGRATLGAMTAEECIDADRKGKVAKNQAKTVASEMKFCVDLGVPNFGYTSAMNVNTQGEAAEQDLMHDLFGNPIDGGLFLCNPNEDECSCQTSALHSIEKLMAKTARIFQKCKKSVLKDNAAPAASSADLQKCFDDPGTPLSVAADSGGQIADTVEFLTGTLADKCDTPGVTATAFPGPACTGLTGTIARDCIRDLVRCRICLMIDAMDNFALDCDQFDDGAVNTSCPP